MDEQRLNAYLQLIQALLECPNGAKDILVAHEELVDADFFCASHGSGSR